MVDITKHHGTTGCLTPCMLYPYILYVLEYMCRAHLVSDENSDVITPIKIYQDANIYVSELSPPACDVENADSEASVQSLQYELKEGRQAYFLCMEGDVLITGSHGQEILNRHDAAEIYGPNTFTTSVVAGSGNAAHVLMVEMEYTGLGRTDI
jgi:hypothetical protein